MTLTLAPETEASLQILAALRNEAPEAVVDAAIKELLRQEPVQDTPAVGESEEDRQRRLHALMDDLLAKAHEIVPEPYDSPTRTYYRESEVGKIIAEKFRKQGFNV
jgi:predicted transcriptional regulator